MSYIIKRLGPAGIIDQAVTLLRNRLTLFFLITLIAYVPLEFFRCLMVEDAMERVGSFNPDFTPEQLQTFLREISTAASPGHGIFTWLGLLLVIPFTNAALIHAMSNEYLGKPISFGAAIRTGFSKLGSVVWSDVLEYLALCGLLIATIVFSAIAAPMLSFAVILPILAAAALFAYIMVRLSLSSHAVVIENIRGAKALERSGQLMTGNYSTFFVLGLLVGIIRILVAVFGAVAGFIPNQYVRVAIECCLEGALYALSVAVFLVFYFSCRCNLEQFDLTLLADHVKVDSPPNVESDSN